MVRSHGSLTSLDLTYLYISMRIDVDHAASRFALAFDFIAASSQCSLATLHRTGVFRHMIYIRSHRGHCGSWLLGDSESLWITVDHS